MCTNQWHSLRRDRLLERSRRVWRWSHRRWTRLGGQSHDPAGKGRSHLRYCWPTTHKFNKLIQYLNLCFTANYEEVLQVYISESHRFKRMGASALIISPGVGCYHYLVWSSWDRSGEVAWIGGGAIVEGDTTTTTMNWGCWGERNSS